MKPIANTQKRFAIVYDADRVTDPEPQMFSPEHWKAQYAVRGSAPGRGSALFLDTPMGAAVLRRYYRGGWPARFSRDRYLFTGWERTRAWVEFRLLARLFADGLPVPAPWAGYADRSGLAYRCALLMQRLPGTVTLDALIAGQKAGPALFARVGVCIRRFHEAGVHHADLNVRNVLVDEPGGRVYLVDFDRGRYRPGSPVDGKANLRRLRRSLQKHWPMARHPEMGSAWKALLDGYHG
ncbi:MAG: 3-deoxy-D-manno-octulosonic acid kinase [Xanthomonadales bacterium]|nr:3-deoxy-D-manno-octulosonic acid kinase [Xanthomonadales bacterium]